VERKTLLGRKLPSLSETELGAPGAIDQELVPVPAGKRFLRDPGTLVGPGEEVDVDLVDVGSSSEEVDLVLLEALDEVTLVDVPVTEEAGAVGVGVGTSSLVVGTATGAEVALGVAVTVMYLRQVPAARRPWWTLRPWKRVGMAATLIAKTARTQSRYLEVNIADGCVWERRRKAKKTESTVFMNKKRKTPQYQAGEGRDQKEGL